MDKSKKTNIPPWLPDWTDKTQYPDPDKAPGRVWAWEFLRRNLQYQQLWEKYAELAPGLIHLGHSAYVFADLNERFEQDFGVWTPAPPSMTIANPDFR